MHLINWTKLGTHVLPEEDAFIYDAAMGLLILSATFAIYLVLLHGLAMLCWKQLIIDGVLEYVMCYYPPTSVL